MASKPLPETLRLFEILHDTRIKLWYETGFQTWRVESVDGVWDVKRDGPNIEIFNARST